MRMAILGGGQQGSACVLDWLRQPDVTSVLVVDSDADRVESLQRRFQDGRIQTLVCDVGDEERLIEALRGSAALVSAVPYFLNVGVTKTAIASGVHLVDMGGNTEVVFQQRSLDEDARAANVAVIPDQGLAPGLACILAAHAVRGFDEVDSVRMRVGGLPQHPRGPLQYALVFSIHGLINEYVGDAVVLENGEIARRPTLTGLEAIRFPAPVGRCEAAYTSGGTSTLPWTLRGRVRDLDYKTVRYPGHWRRFAFLKKMGLLDSEPVKVGRLSVSPRDMLASVLEPRLTIPETRDLVVLRVSVTGRKDGKIRRRRFDLLDYFDEKTGLTAMMRTTAFPTSETALLLARGQIAERGVLAAETVVPGDRYVRSLRARGMRIRDSETVVRQSQDD
jgi:lysine 6-dehydrogenase